jgi:hypothetical protein
MFSSLQYLIKMVNKIDTVVPYIRVECATKNNINLFRSLFPLRSLSPAAVHFGNLRVRMREEQDTKIFSQFFQRFFFFGLSLSFFVSALQRIFFEEWVGFESDVM